MGPSSKSADNMIKDILDTMTENDYNIVHETLNEFQRKYIESGLPDVYTNVLDDETCGFQINDLTPKQRLYLKILGYRIICKWDPRFGATISTLNFK